MKTRFNKPFESYKLRFHELVWIHSGFVDLFEKKGLLVKQGNRLKYIDRMGKEHLHYRKQWTGENLDLVMAEFKEPEKINKTQGANDDANGVRDAD